METTFVETDYDWTEKLVIGLSLLIMEGQIDSFGDRIKGNIFYKVGKHKKSGKVAILPTNENHF